ncbi:MAG: hypothetical protein V4739_09800 [Pseudomonadota bacterium]
MNVIESLLLLGLALSGAVVAHALLGRVVKVLLWAWSPLASGEAEACTYQRSVYFTAEPALLVVVGVAAASGLAWGLGLVWHTVFSPWLMMAGVLGVLAALGLDLQRWERVAVSAHNVWFQRGLGHTVHQLAIDNIRDVSVQESAEGGFTLRRGRRNRSIRLSLRTLDKRLIALPKTDARSGLEAVENMANFLRLRLQQQREAALEKAQAEAVKPPLRQRDISRPLSSSPGQGSAPAAVRRTPTPLNGPLPVAAPVIKKLAVPPLVLDVVAGPPAHDTAPNAPTSPEDEELQRALRRLRLQNTTQRQSRTGDALADPATSTVRPPGQRPA